MRPERPTRPRIWYSSVSYTHLATLEKGGKTCDLRKLMALMGMGVKQGDTVTVKVEEMCIRDSLRALRRATPRVNGHQLIVNASGLLK